MLALFPPPTSVRELPRRGSPWRRYVGQLRATSRPHRKKPNGSGFQGLYLQTLKNQGSLAERVEKLSRVCILEAIRKKLPDAFSRPDLDMVALDYFRRLGHDNHRRLSKLYAWVEKKSKTSWGAQTVDYEKIVATAVEAMNDADLHRFLVVCALVSDLYCPGYDPKQSLAKDSNLTRTATRYKTDPEGIREQFERNYRS